MENVKKAWAYIVAHKKIAIVVAVIAVIIILS